MEPLRPIFWGQGLFLQPQHFQQQDLYHEARLRHYLQLIYPYCWGVRTLRVNETALRNYLFEIEHCDIVTPEGTILSFRGDSTPSNTRIAPRSFELELDPEGKALEVFLGIKRLQWEDNNISEDVAVPENGRDTGATRRFRLHESRVPNLFGAEAERSAVQFLLYEAHLLFDADTVHSGRYEVVKIAEVARTAQEHGIVLHNRYIPPLLSVHASPVLLGMLRQVRDQLTAKSRELQEFKRQRGGRPREMGARDTFFMFIMQLVNRSLPLVRHCLEIEETHPCQAYAMIRQLTGELSTFSERVSLVDQPLSPYRHEQLWECFEPAIRLIFAMLSELTRGPEFVVPLVFDGEYFSSDLEPRFFDEGNRYYLSITSNLSPRELERQLMETGKVCSREEMTALRQRALSGLPAHYLEVPPEDLPRQALCTYFELDHHAALWRRIKERQNLAVSCELSSEDTEMQVVVLSAN